MYIQNKLIQDLILIVILYLGGKFVLFKYYYNLNSKCIVCWENSGYLIKNSRCACNYHYHLKCIKYRYMDTCFYCRKKFINPYTEYAGIGDRTLIYMLNPKIALASLGINIFLFGIAYWLKN